MSLSETLISNIEKTKTWNTSNKPKRNRQRTRGSRTRTCEYCNKRNLRWINLGTRNSPRWRLHDEEGNMHYMCDEFRKHKKAQEEMRKK